MSELKYTLDIKPTRHGTRIETNYVRNIPCPRCNAQGGFVDKTGRNEYAFAPCDFCDGTGKVKATITVEWNADYDS